MEELLAKAKEHYNRMVALEEKAEQPAVPQEIIDFVEGQMDALGYEREEGATDAE